MEELVLKIKKENIIIDLIDGQLKLDIPKGANVDKLIEEIKVKKDELIAYLRDTSHDLSESVNPIEDRDYYPLSSAQKRLFFMYEMDRHSLAYNEKNLVRMKGDLNRSRLEECFAKLIGRHDSLRTCIELLPDGPVQKIKSEIDFAIEEFQSDEAGIEAIIDEFIRPFDISQVPLMRVGLINIDEKEYILMVDMHHIITDGLSQSILVHEFMSMYNGQLLPAPALQYKDYAVWQQSEAQQAALAKQKEFWLLEFSEQIAVLNLPTDFTRPTNKSYEGNSIRFSIGMEETAKLKSIAAASDATMFMVILTVYNILLSKLSNQEDIVVGTPVAGRNHSALTNIFGMFANTLCLRNYPKGELTFTQFLGMVQSNTLSCLDNQDYQYEELVNELKVDRDTSRNPLFDVMFVYGNFTQTELSIPDLSLQYYSKENLTSKFDLLLSCADHNDRLHFRLEYYSKIHSLKSIERYIRYFKKIVSIVIVNADVELRKIELLSKSDKHQILNSFNATEKEYDDQKTVHRLFEEQVGRTLDSIALTHNKDSLSYRELNIRSNQLAYVLRNKGVTRNSVVGVIIDRSFDMVISLLAIIKAGGAYLPIDPNLPPDRIEYMISDSKPAVLLTDSDYTELNFDNRISECLNVRDIELDGKERGNPIETNSTIDLLYVIYTSGSTGKPKGVMVNHSNITNLIDYEQNHISVDFSSVLQFATLNFDPSVMEIFSTLLKGGKVSLVDKEVILDVSNLLNYIQKNLVKTIYMPSSILNQLFNSEEHQHILPSTIKHIVSAGEQVIVGKLFKKYLQKNCIYLHNHYGPAETHVVTANKLSPNEEIPTMPSIGKPIQNTCIYILDGFKQLQPVNVAGELYVGGKQVGDGYIGNPEITSEKFVENPFRPNDRIYKTGDLARWLPDGSIEFMGRIDDQLKIRGIRIEPGEIESWLNAHDDIVEAVVIAKEWNGRNHLTAYYVSEEALDTADLRIYLLSKLPDYMVPAYFIHLKELPLTSTGKLFRKGLPDPKIIAEENYEPPGNEIEKRLVEIWSEILKLTTEAISVNQSFFEMGGHSLNATYTVNKMNEEFRKYIPLQMFFKMSTIREIALFIKSFDDNEATAEYVDNQEIYNF